MGGLPVRGSPPAVPRWLRQQPPSPYGLLMPVISDSLCSTVELLARRAWAARSVPFRVRSRERLQLDRSPSSNLNHFMSRIGLTLLAKAPPLLALAAWSHPAATVKQANCALLERALLASPRPLAPRAPAPARRLKALLLAVGRRASARPRSLFASRSDGAASQHFAARGPRLELGFAAGPPSSSGYVFQKRVHEWHSKGARKTLNGL